MGDAKRMQPVARIAEHRERSDARELGQARRRLADMQQKLQELQIYRDEYARRFEAMGNSGLQAPQLCDYRTFLSRLSEAIVQQETAIARAIKVIDEQRQNWIQSRSRAQALDKVVKRYQRQEQAVERRREQHECDEHTTRKVDRRKD